MKKTAIIISLLLACGIYGLSATHLVYASDVQISDVQLLDVGNTPNIARIQFTLSQKNSFGDLTYDGRQYSDYIWVFIKYAVLPISESVGYEHATLASGTGTIGAYNSSAGEGIALDGKGVFIKASNAGAPPGKTFSVLWNFGTDGVLATDNVKIKACAIEMVKIPEGPFYYNVPWYPGQPGAFSVGGSAGNNYGGGAEVVVGSINDKPTGSATNWANGYKSFYIMKYEISQGQYVDFLNMLPAITAATRFNSKVGIPYGSLYQYTITYDNAKPYGERYKADVSERACNYIDWDDALDYSSWAALRPMTEMEFEKAARGTSISIVNESTYPFGDCFTIHPPNAINPTYLPLGHISPYVALKYYANHTKDDYIDGPTNVGNYVSGDIPRTDTDSVRQTGVSVYGVTDLAGNLWERVISCVSLAKPVNGDGIVRTSYTSLGWPGLKDKFPTYIGHGLRGGGFGHGYWDLQISGRALMSSTSTEGHYYDTNSYSAGFRCARTVD